MFSLLLSALVLASGGGPRVPAKGDGLPVKTPRAVGMTDVERAVKGMPGVRDVQLNLVWTPFWSPELIEPRVRAYMGL